MANNYNNPRRPYCATFSVAQGHTWTLTGDSPFGYVQIVNDHPVLITLNGDAVNGTFTVAANSTQIFNPNDVRVSTLKVSNLVSGASTAALTVIVSYDDAAPSVSTT